MPRRFSVLLSLSVAGLAAGLAAGCTEPASQPPPGSAAVSPASAASASPPVTLPTPSPPAETDPWLLATDGIGPYRLGARLDSMPAGLFGDSHAIDPAQCPDLYSRSATGKYLGVALPVVRHGVLVEISSSGGDPGVHTPAGDRVGDPWATIETRYAAGSASPGDWRTDPVGNRAFVVPRGERVLMFYVNPVRPNGVGAITVGLTDYSLQTFLTGEPC